MVVVRPEPNFLETNMLALTLNGTRSGGGPGPRPPGPAPPPHNPPPAPTPG